MKSTILAPSRVVVRFGQTPKGKSHPGIHPQVVQRRVQVEVTKLVGKPQANGIIGT
jgi:hypothetical protein